MVLSDNWHQPVGPDWAECSLWVREAQVHDLPRILEAEGDAWYSKGLAAQEAFRRFFDRSTIFGHYTAAVESLLPACAADSHLTAGIRQAGETHRPSHRLAEPPTLRSEAPWIDGDPVINELSGGSLPDASNG
jgi:hypothetical protein